MNRNESWLQEKLDYVWDSYFADIPQHNDVKIIYGRRAKRRLGSISIDPKDHTITIITINSLFKDTDIPEEIVVATIVHELSHYAHGFNSPLQRTKAFPHSGGVMRKEYEERGLLDLYLYQKKWLHQFWPDIVFKAFPPRKTSPASVGASSWRFIK